MVIFFLNVGKESFKIVAFSELAESILQLPEGSVIGISGTGSTSKWQDNQGEWKSQFQVSAWAAEIDGEIFEYQQQEKQPPPASNGRDSIPEISDQDAIF